MPIDTVYARKAGRRDWLAMVHIDDHSDLYRLYLGSRRFPTAPLARVCVTRRLCGTVPPNPTTSPGTRSKQYRWRQVSVWDDDYGLVIDAEAEPVENSGRHAYRTSDGRIVWDDDPGQAAEPPEEVTR
jgi:hypothetical protein